LNCHAGLYHQNRRATKLPEARAQAFRSTPESRHAGQFTLGSGFDMSSGLPLRLAANLGQCGFQAGKLKLRAWRIDGAHTISGGCRTNA